MNQEPARTESAAPCATRHGVNPREVRGRVRVSLLLAVCLGACSHAPQAPLEVPPTEDLRRSIHQLVVEVLPAAPGGSASQPAFKAKGSVGRAQGTLDGATRGAAEGALAAGVALSNTGSLGWMLAPLVVPTVTAMGAISGAVGGGVNAVPKTDVRAGLKALNHLESDGQLGPLNQAL